MKCINCSRTIPENSLFCNWCGSKQIKEKKKTISVPEPKQLPSGSWRIQLMVNGTRQSLTGEDPAALKAQAIALKSGLIEKEKAAPKLTLGTAIDNYISSRSSVLSPSTVRGYQQIRENRFTHYMAKDINSINFQRMINEEADLCSPKTLKNSWALVNSALLSAGVKDLSVLLPAVPKADTTWLDPDQIKQFIPLILDNSAAIPALLALHSLRRSEIFGLDWEDIDLKNELIHIHGSVVDGPNGAVEKKTNKTTSSDRTIKILIPELKQLLEAVPPKERTGKVYEAQLERPYKNIIAICKRNGLPAAGVHSLRRSFASLCYHLNIGEMETMAMGGWSDYSTVRRVYTFLSQRDLKAGQKKLKKFFKN